MLEFTEQQIQALANPDITPPRIINPQTHETYILLRVEEYEKLRDAVEYDDSPWTSEERHTLAWEAGKHAGWDEMDEYDNLPE